MGGDRRTFLLIHHHVHQLMELLTFGIWKLVRKEFPQNQGKTVHLFMDHENTEVKRKSEKEGER